MFYTGQSEDGTDALQTGVYLSPDGNEWSSEPYTTEQKEHRKQEQLFRSIISYLKKKYNENRGFDKKLQDEYNLILQKKSGLGRKEREFLIQYFEE